MFMASRPAHYDDDKHCWRIWNYDACISALKLACEEAGEAITIDEFESLHRVEPDIYPCAATIRKLMGSWNYAIRAIGYEPNRRGRPGQRDYEIEDLSSVYFG
jgi:hypothetical protein